MPRRALSNLCRVTCFSRKSNLRLRFFSALFLPGVCVRYLAAPSPLIDAGTGGYDRGSLIYFPRTSWMTSQPQIYSGLPLSPPPTKVTRRYSKVGSICWDVRLLGSFWDHPLFHLISCASRLDFSSSLIQTSFSFSLPLSQQCCLLPLPICLAAVHFPSCVESQ